jgi:molybdate transport system substrate-binding protein
MWSRTISGLAWAAVGVCLAARIVGAQPAALTIASASDLQAVLPAIASAFEKASGAKVTLTFGSSGNFFAQIQNGAPFDVFLSADIDYPRRLEAAGQAERGSLYEYATGRIALWTRRDSSIDVSRGLAVLTDPSVKRIAVANPQYAPYGRAAVAALRHEGLYERVQSKLVFGDNISQTAQFASTGDADVGLIALSLAAGSALKTAGTFFLVPDGFHPPIEQAAIVVATSKQKALAARFVRYLATPDVQRVLEASGLPAPRAPGR